MGRPDHHLHQRVAFDRFSTVTALAHELFCLELPLVAAIAVLGLLERPHVSSFTPLVLSVFVLTQQLLSARVLLPADALAEASGIFLALLFTFLTTSSVYILHNQLDLAPKLREV